MTSNQKCRSQLGPNACGNPNCPEKHLFVPPVITIPKVFELQAVRTKPTLPFGGWSEENTVLFKTEHGSKLYGLAHAESDDDFFVVTPTVKVARQSRKNTARQSFQGNSDTVYMDFKTFTRLASEGVPQALETMYSRQSRSEFFEDYRQGYFSSDPQVIHTYMRTIKAFSMHNGNNKDMFKRRRHALRLSLNLEEMLYTGRFNPTLSPTNAARITRFAAYEPTKYFTELEKICPIEVDWREAFVTENKDANVTAI